MLQRKTHVLNIIFEISLLLLPPALLLLLLFSIPDMVGSIVAPVTGPPPVPLP